MWQIYITLIYAFCFQMNKRTQLLQWAQHAKLMGLFYNDKKLKYRWKIRAFTFTRLSSHLVFIVCSDLVHLQMHISVCKLQPEGCWSLHSPSASWVNSAEGSEVPEINKNAMNKSDKLEPPQPPLQTGKLMIMQVFLEEMEMEWTSATLQYCRMWIQHETKI